MKKIVFLDTDTLGNDVDLDIFKSFGEVTFHPFTTSEETLERIIDAHIIVTNKVILNESILSQTKNLELICITATGTNNVDLIFAKENKITVKNVEGYSTDSVAEHTFSLLLELLHKTAYYDKFIKSGSYSNHPIFTHLNHSITEIKGKRFGIVGLGNIGKRVAEIAKVFGAEVVYFSTSGKNSNADYTRLDWDQFLQTCDIISIHSPLNVNTLHLFNNEAFSKVKSNLILLNNGRGNIIEEKALVEAIKNNKIKACALDVFEFEPLKSNSVINELFAFENVVLTPHIAWASVEARKILMQKTFQNISQFYSLS